MRQTSLRSVRLALFAIAACWSLVSTGASLEGKPAPAIEAKLLDGGSFKLAGAGGAVVMVNYWATWCVPCRAEMPAIDAYYRKHRDEGLKIIAISMDDPKDEQKVREVMKDFAFPAAMARDVNMKGYGRIWRIPLTFVIDRQGVVRKDGWFGDPGLDVPLLEREITPLLRAR